MAKENKNGVDWSIANPLLPLTLSPVLHSIDPAGAPFLLLIWFHKQEKKEELATGRGSQAFFFATCTAAAAAAIDDDWLSKVSKAVASCLGGGGGGDGRLRTEHVIFWAPSLLLFYNKMDDGRV